MKTIYIIILLIFSYSLSEAQVDRSKSPLPGPAPKIKIGEYKKFQLSNGLKVFVVENHRIPRVSFSISFIFDPPTEAPNQGIGNMTASLIGTGTTSRTKDQINEEIDFIGGTLDASSSGIYASSLTKYISKLLDVLSDVTIHSVFKPEEVEKQRTQFLSGLAAEKDDPESIAANVSSALFFGKNHPYGEFETESSIQRITPEMCTSYYSTYFKPNIAYLSIVGDITPAQAKKLAEKYFGSWKKGEVTNPEYDKPQPPQTTRVAMVDRPQSVQSIINIGYPVDLTLASPDYIKSNVMNTVLGGGVFRLFNNLREKHAFTYGAYSRLRTRPLLGSFKASTNVRNNVTDSAVTQIMYEMRRIRNEPVADDELQRVKNYLNGNFALSLEDPQTIAAFAANIERYKLPKDFYENYLKNIEAVSPADVKVMADKYILPDRSFILVVGKSSEIADKLKKFSPDGKIEFYDTDANLYDPSKKTSAVPAGVTAKSVLQKYIDASGGDANISKIKDLTYSGTMEIQGMKLNMNMVQKLPGKFMMQILMNGQPVQKIILNGNTAKMSGMQGNKEISGEELDKLKLQANPFPENHYESYGYKTELKGVEKVSDQDAYVIDVTSPSGSVTTEYYSVESGLKIRTVSSTDTPMGKTTQIADVLGYTDVNGIRFPNKIKTSVGPQTIVVNIDSIQMNTGVQDSSFQ